MTVVYPIIYLQMVLILASIRMETTHIIQLEFVDKKCRSAVVLYYVNHAFNFNHLRTCILTISVDS